MTKQEWAALHRAVRHCEHIERALLDGAIVLTDTDEALFALYRALPDPLYKQLTQARQERQEFRDRRSGFKNCFSYGN